jgi:mannosyltransferase OCH1-like enzyme
MIPKVVHRIWFGPEPMRRELLEYGRSWERHGYELQLWTEQNLPELRNAQLYADLEKWGVDVGGGDPRLGLWVQRADIAAYEIAWRYGGIVANTDIECLRPLDALLDGVSAFAGYEVGVQVCNALIGCTPQHEFFDRLLEELTPFYYLNRYRPMNLQTGPALITHVHEQNPGLLTVFDEPVFYPNGYSQMEREWDRPETAWTVHHWGHTRGRATQVPSDDFLDSYLGADRA